MKIWLWTTFLVASLVQSNQSADASEVVDWAKVNAWSVRIDKTMNNGCFTYAVYKRGSAFRVGPFQEKDKSMSVYIMVTNVNWKSLEAGKDYPIGIQFGNEPKWNGEARAIYIGGLKALFLGIDDKGKVDFVEEFMRKTVVRIFYAGDMIGELSLKGSFRAFQETMKCQKYVSGLTSKKARSDPFTKKADDPFSSQRSRNKDPFR